ncbi:MAM domain-containing glycosylphosphatidylinositol anchor protein 1-like [Ranitomeya variabilis]|uniref:MAM domain-containing glycosylphosphatidylinositol anchor protein 1-like n=1 Tax=Ranitomeya variabilis TaxID=490064 RepID=UPI004056E55E
MEPLRSVRSLMVLVLLYPGADSSGDKSLCTPGITMEGNQNSGTLPGQSLVLNCLVRLCDLELPNVTWCKVVEQQCDPLRNRDGIYSKLEDQREDSAIYVLKFDSVQINDTGYYNCKAKFKNQEIIGRTVELNIFGDRSSCTPRITMEGNQNSGTLPGQSLVLNCIVRLCDLELPNVTWCKIAEQQCDPLRTRDGIYSKLEDQREDSAVYVLKFDSAQINDTGYYLCKAKFKNQEIIGRTVELVIFAQPSTFLKLNSDGSLECGAIDGDPPAEISWIPNLGDIITTELENPDGMWSVVSTFRRSGINGISVTCVVSHPTFVNPWKADITLSGGYKLRFDIILRLIVTVIFTVLFIGFLLYLKINCQNIPREQKNEDR